MYEPTSPVSPRVLRSGRTVNVAPPDSPPKATSSTVTLDDAHVKRHLPESPNLFLVLEHH